MMRSEKEKMLAGELYHAGAPELQADAAKARAWMSRYNDSMAASADDRRALLRELLGAVGDGAVVRPPFLCDYGYNIRLGSDVFLNFNCIILDVVQVIMAQGRKSVRRSRSMPPTILAIQECARAAPNSGARS